MNYLLTEANQNTFILYDLLDKQGVDTSFLPLARQSLEQEQRDDALILVNGHSVNGSYHAKMVVLGLDGELGEFCGNGARACGAYLFKKFPDIRQFYLETGYGTHPLNSYGKEVYSVKLPLPSYDIDRKFIADPDYFKRTYPWTFVNMIEPHLTLKGEMSDEELHSLGKELNADKKLFPLGINLNVWHVREDDTLFVKTYERGVQRLTRSCGTGSLSCASQYIKEGTLKVFTPGGPLDIILHADGIELKGPVGSEA